MVRSQLIGRRRSRSPTGGIGVVVAVAVSLACLSAVRQDPAMGVAELFDVVVLSVEHGYRKPYPSIYAAALDQLATRAEGVAFVGDSYDADFVGPRRAGMASFLIDPHDRHGVGPSDRLVTVLEAESRLR